MKRLPLVSLLTALLASTGVSQGATQVYDADREILLLVRDDAILVSNSAGQFSPAEPLYRSPSLRAILVAPGVEAIGRACPEATPDQNLKTLPDGRLVRSLDLSRLFRVRVQSADTRAALLGSLQGHPDVVLAELNERIRFRIQPNDTGFVRQWSLQNVGRGSGKPGADIDATLGWDQSQGWAFHKVGIVDKGVYAAHEDLAGRVSGQTGESDHATRMAGVIGAYANNTKGITGIDWVAPLISGLMALEDIPGAAQAIRYVVDAGVGVINAGWGVANHSDVLVDAVAYAYQHNVLISAAQPWFSDTGDFPAKCKNMGVMSVAATTNQDKPAPYTEPRYYTDVAAPGGEYSSDLTMGIYSTPTAGYSYEVGTSFAAAHATGVASVLRGRAMVQQFLDFSGNDARGIIRANADDILPTGVDDSTGYGRVNLLRTMKNFGTGGVGYMATWYAATAVGGQDMGASSLYSMRFYNVPGLPTPPGGYTVKIHEVQRTITPGVAPGTSIWGLGSTTGWPGIGPEVPQAERALFNTGWCEPVLGNWQSGYTMITYVYQVFNSVNGYLGWYPCEPSQVVFRYRVYRPAIAGSPITAVDPTQSFYVPEAGAVASPMVGTNATQWFRTCPNNDSGSLPNSARIRLVVRDAAGAAIAGVEPAEIFMLFNGGTTAQGFSGQGADSIIANQLYNPSPLCPDVRMVIADAPTDAGGVTFITFTGSAPGNPGVGVRNPQRKWGHYDSVIPVYVKGTAIQGRLIEAQANGSYALQIKNVDLEMGLGTAMNLGEMVTSSDYASVNAHVNEPDSADPKNWWRDFNSSGIVDSGDFSLVVNHLNHNCTTPNNP
jgi:hypothetical protein